MKRNHNISDLKILKKIYTYKQYNSWVNKTNGYTETIINYINLYDYFRKKEFNKYNV